MTSRSKTQMQKTYRQQYWKTHRQITTVVSLAEFRELEARGNGFSLTPGQLVLAESRAYQNQTFVPPIVMIERLDDIRRLLRNCAGQLNQMSKLSNTFNRFMVQHDFVKVLQHLEAETERLIRQPWPTSVPPNSKGGNDDHQIIIKND